MSKLHPAIETDLQNWYNYGIGGMVNHAIVPNCVWMRAFDRMACVVMVSVRDIAAEEELTVNYGNDLMFADAGAKENQQKAHISDVDEEPAAGAQDKGEVGDEEEAENESDDAQMSAL